MQRYKKVRGMLLLTFSKTIGRKLTQKAKCTLLSTSSKSKKTEYK